MKTLEEVKQILKQTKPFLRDHYQITQLGLFSSYIRGEQTEISDIDVLVDYEQAPTLIMLISLFCHFPLFPINKSFSKSTL